MPRTTTITYNPITYAFGGQVVATRIINGSSTLYYIHNDHPSTSSGQALGSNSRMSTNAGSAVTNSIACYTPFGDWRTEPTAGLTDRGYTGHLHNNLGSGSDDIGLIYMNARYYLPGVGRFLSADTIVPDPANPQSYNRYSYTYNNPINHIDPSGHDSWWCGDDQGCIIESNRSMANRTLSKLDGQYFCTSAYGCFDINHVRPTKVLNVIRQISSGHVVITGQLEKHSVQIELTTHYEVSTSLTDAQKAGAITGMLYDYERRWEGFQGSLLFRAGKSSFYSPEDLPSDHIGTYIGLNYPLSAYNTPEKLRETFAEVAATFLGGAYPVDGVPHPRENVTIFGSPLPIGARMQNREFLPFVETSTGWGNVPWPNPLQLTPIESNGSTWEFQWGATCQGWGCF